MTPRKVKHERMLKKRQEFFRTVKEGNLDVLTKVHDHRAEERKKTDKDTKDKKIEKSKKLAKQHKQQNGVQINAEYAEERRKKENDEPSQAQRATR